MLGRRLETEGDVEGAIAAHKRAAEVDPRSAEIRAELAGLYARQDRPRDAIEWAEAALTLDAASAEAHRVLGLIYAALVDRPTAASRIGLSDATSDEFAARALSHLERADAETLADASLHFALGRLHVRQRSYQKAIAAFRRLLEDEPGVSEASLLLAEAYEGAGQFDEARRTLEDAIAEEPGLVRARLQLAELFERQGRWSGAAGQYALALEASPSDLELVRRQALAWLQADEPARARDLLQGLAKNGKAGASELYLLFQAERDLDDLDAADATARKLTQQAPDDVRGPHAVAQVLDRRRDYRAIVNLLEPIVARNRQRERGSPQIGALVTQLGFAYQALREYDRAIRAFEDQRSLSPSEPAGALYVVQAYLVAGRLDEAAGLADRARQQFPDEMRLVDLEAEILRRQGRVDQGVALVNDALGRRETVSLYVTLSELHVAAKRYGEAADVLGRAREKFPNDETVPFQLGAVFERAGRAGDAERIFRDLVARDPLNAAALNYLGYMLAERGRSLEEAVALITRALERDPGNPAYLDSLGWAYFKLGRLDQAERHLRAAAGQLVTNSVVQDHLGDLLSRVKRFDEAIVAWQRALAGDGESIDRAVIDAKIREARGKSGRR